MNIWILTIGSSDVQLDSDSQSKDKGRTTKSFSDQTWNYWYTDELKATHHLPNSAKPTRSFADKDETYRVSPRILGTVYKASPKTVQQEILGYLTFPLLDNFVSKLKDMNVEDSEKYPLPAAIVLLLTDQLAILTDRKLKSFYWQDTCELEPILHHYLMKKFPDIVCQPVLLDPKEVGKGLDNWDAVLDLVGQRFKHLEINGNSVEVREGENAYVSHQAGTPAISSAVQFCSLAKFGDRVRFLVSNEDKSELTGFVESSNYLRGIKREQAKELLENYDYAGVNKLIREYLLNEDTKILLDAGIQWNFAKFEEFADKLLQLTNPELQELVQSVSDRRQYYWWTAYEAAYLATVRHSQKNMVEALFHSFRAVEGLICEWAIVKYKPYIYYDEKGSPQISEKVKEVIPEY